MTALQLKELSHSGLYRRRRDRPDSVLPGSQEESLRWVRMDGAAGAPSPSLLPACFGGFNKQNSTTALEGHCKTHASRSSPEARQRHPWRRDNRSHAVTLRVLAMLWSLPWLWEGQMSAAFARIPSAGQHSPVNKRLGAWQLCSVCCEASSGSARFWGLCCLLGLGTVPAPGWCFGAGVAAGLWVSSWGGFFGVLLGKRMQQGHLAWPYSARVTKNQKAI